MDKENGDTVGCTYLLKYAHKKAAAMNDYELKCLSLLYSRSGARYHYQRDHYDRVSLHSLWGHNDEKRGEKNKV